MKRYLIISCLFLFLFLCYINSGSFHRLYNRYLQGKYIGEREEISEDWYDMNGHMSLEYTPIFMDMCAVVRVTKGMEDSLGEAWTNEPSQIWDAVYEDIEVEVEEYLYDLTGNYCDHLVIRDMAGLDKWRRLYAYTGERMILFIQAVGSGLCNAYSDWTFILSDFDRLVPMTGSYCKEMNDYGAYKLERYKKDVTEVWDEYLSNKNYSYAIGNSIMEFTGETDWSKSLCGFHTVKEKEIKGKNIKQITLLFIQQFLDEEGWYRDDAREGIIEIVLEKEGNDYHVAEYHAIYKEEIEKKLEEELTSISKKELEDFGYPSEEFTQILRESMGEMSHMTGQDLEHQKVYDLFISNYNKYYNK